MINSDQEKIDLLSDFIDTLNKEKKPSNHKKDKEMEQLFETVRAVKRLRADHNVREIPTNKQTKKPKQRLLTRYVTIASIFLLLIISASILPLPFSGEQNMVHAMVTAYNQLKSYSGVIEIKSMTNGELDYFESIEVQYKAPNKFKAMHHSDGVTITQTSNGNVLYRIDNNQITINYSTPEQELWRYHLKGQIEQISNAEGLEKIGTDTIAGREAEIYQYHVINDSYSNKVWIDKETKLPLKTELRVSKDKILTNAFVQIEINPTIQDTVFEQKTEPKSNQTVVEQSKQSDLESLKQYWEIEPIFAEKISTHLEEKGFLLENVIELEDNLWYSYLMKFKNTDNHQEFLDIYFGKNMETSKVYSVDSSVGLLDEGWIEANTGATNVFKSYIGNSNIVKWTQFKGTDDWQLFVVSHLSTDEMVGILEKMNGEKVEFASKESLKELGVEPTYSKENH